MRSPGEQVSNETDLVPALMEAGDYLGEDLKLRSR